MIYVEIARTIAELHGFKTEVVEDRFFYWKGEDIFSTLITDSMISELQFRRNLGYSK